ncbi:MAG TPA: hypothetical protein VIJ71_02730, partial [Mycobacteriales bacterium]
GGIGAIVCTLIFSLHGTSSSTLAKYAKRAPSGNFYDPSDVFMITILILLAVSLGFAFAPWMASFTETVERHNPALTATGLAVWGMTIRVVIAIAIFIAPHIVSTVTPLVEKGPILQGYLSDRAPIQTSAGNTTVGAVSTAVAGNAAIVGQVSTDGAKYKSQLTAAALVQAKVDPTTLAALQANPNDAAAGLKAISEITGLTTADVVAGLTSNPAVTGAVTDLKTAATLPPSVATLFGTTAPKALGAANFAALIASPMDPQLTGSLDYLQANGTQVAKAAADSPAQWRNYFWVAIGGEIVFLPLVFLMAGFWDPRKAKEAEDEHHAMVTAELAKLHTAGT